jgi:hypothetical protein
MPRRRFQAGLVTKVEKTGGLSMRRIAFCLFALSMVLPLGCKGEDATESTTTTTDSTTTDTDADGTTDAADTADTDATEQ